MTGASAAELLVAATWPLLVLHAVRSHGVAYAAIWLGDTAALGALAAWGRLHHGRAIEFGSASVWIGPIPLHYALWFGSVIYLGALLAKGFVERSHHRGRIGPFVLAHASLAALVGAPVLSIAGPAGWWSTPSLPRDLAALALAGFTFGLAYRIVTRFTQHDPTKLLVLTLTLPLQVAAQRLW